MPASDPAVPTAANRPQRILLLGATGTIGSATARLLSQQGYEVVYLLRPRSGPAGQTPLAQQLNSLAGTTLCYGELNDAASLCHGVLKNEKFDAVISCMASRTGSPKDAWRVDYQSNVVALQVAQASGARQFVLLSAICVQKPLLTFQKAKLAFEEVLMQSGLVYSIVRPTAFFKSLSGQLERVKRGKPFLLFGDGELTACKPISDDDLADYLVGCLSDPSRHQRILPIGGPGPAITPLQQGEYLFHLLGMAPRFKRVPLGLMDFIIAVLDLAGKMVPRLGDKAELARIGRYYATESMLVWDAEAKRYDADQTPSHGKQTLFDAYAAWLQGEKLPERGDHAVF
jgi:divinyl chlorophyllide a 8-vinyl-reductase